MQALFESRARQRSWIVVLSAAAIVFFGGWLPGLAAVVLAGMLVWTQLSILRPAARLLSVRRRIVSVWTARLVGTVVVVVAIVATELLTPFPIIGHVGKTLATALQGALLAWWIRRYVVWQTRREGRGEPIGWWEYLLLASAGLLLLVGASVMLYAAFWVTSKVAGVVAGVDALAGGPQLGHESLGFAGLVGLGAATGTRAALFLLVSGGLVILKPEWAAAQLHFLGTPVGLGAALTLMILELATERDDDLQSLFGLAASGARIGIAGFLGATASGQPLGSRDAMMAGALGAGVALAAASSRHWLHALLREIETEAFSPRRWLNRLEEGGVIGLAVAVYAGPMLGIGLVAVGAGAAFIAGFLARRASFHWRRPCPSCGRAIRVEASGCPFCGANVPATRTAIDKAFGAAGSSLQAAMAAGQAASARTKQTWTRVR